LNTIWLPLGATCGVVSAGPSPFTTCSTVMSYSPVPSALIIHNVYPNPSGQRGGGRHKAAFASPDCGSHLDTTPRNGPLGKGVRPPAAHTGLGVGG
jgi:hypothetical protein